MLTWWAFGLALTAFLVINCLGLLVVVNRMSRTEQAVIAVLRYVINQHGDQLPPNVAALIPAIQKGNNRG
jgi:hypothetical protein